MSSRRTISNTFTVTTMDDPVSVQAQYAPNNNPTAGQIHTTWQAGDLYMRTRESDDVAWSAWHKIVGENGGETDYTFGISQYKTTANASTAPSDISSWSDSPLAVTDSKPYLWSKVQKKSWNESTQSYVVDSTRYIRLTGEESVVYRLTPSIKEIVKKKDGTYVPSGNTYITCGVTKNEGGTQSTPSSSEYTLKYSLNRGAETTYTSTSVKVNQVTSNLVFILYVNGVVVDRETIGLITDGTDGTSPYFADLDNEMDSIACTHDGKASSAQTVSTKISMFKGSSAEAFTVDKIYRNGTQMSWDGNNNGVWPRLSGGTVTLEFDSGAAVNIKDDFKITLYATNATSVTRELHFIVNGIRANAIYRLVPSHSQILKKKDGTYVPSGNVTCSVEKTENGSTSTPNASEYTLEKSVNGGSYTTYSATAASSITSDLKFRLTVGGVVVDLETIPLVSDGDKGNTGDSAPVAFATPDKITIPCGISGYVSSALTQGVTFSLKVGTNAATVTGVTSGTKPTGVTVTGQADNAVTITIATTATASGLSAGVTFTVTGTYGGKTYSATVTVALIGAVKGNQGDSITGPRGKMGRIYYYAQEWSNSSSVSYQVTDAEAPYFLYDNNYWVFNPENNGTYTMAAMGTPSSSNTNWKLMVTDFKYIITEAIFGAFAHFGSAIISGDWLMSTNGYINGTAFNNTNISGGIVGGSSFSVKAYTLFDENYPLGDNTNVHESSATTGIESSTTSVTRASNIYLTAGYTYCLVCTGYTNNASHPIYGRVQDGSGNYTVPVNINSTSAVQRSGYFRVATSGYYSIILTQDSGYTGTVTYSKIARVRFAPNYCVDLLTGKSYQNDAYIKGQIVATSGTIDSVTATNLTIKSGIITGDVTIGNGNVQIKLKPLGSGSSVGASIVAYDGTETPFSISFDRYTYSGVYHPHATLKLESIAPYSNKCGKIEISDTQKTRTLYYGSSQIPDSTFTSYEGYESITGFSGMLHKISVNNAYHLRLGITSTGVAVITANAWPTVNDKSSLPTGCIYRDGENLKVKV